MSTPAAAAAALIGAVAGLLASSYLARLTLSVPDRELRDWWRGRPAGRSRTLATAATAGGLGALAGGAAGTTALLAASILLALTAAPLIVIDIEHHRLPDRLVVILAGGVALLITVAAVVDGRWHPWLRAIEGAAAVFVALFILAFISPGSFGYGDVKLGGVLGGYLGWFGWGYVYYGIFAGFLLGAVVAIGLLIGRRGGMKTAIAFGPMLIVGALVVAAFDLVPSLS